MSVPVPLEQHARALGEAEPRVPGPTDGDRGREGTSDKDSAHTVPQASRSQDLWSAEGPMTEFQAESQRARTQEQVFPPEDEDRSEVRQEQFPVMHQNSSGPALTGQGHSHQRGPSALLCPQIPKFTPPRNTQHHG